MLAIWTHTCPKHMTGHVHVTWHVHGTQSMSIDISTSWKPRHICPFSACSDRSVRWKHKHVAGRRVTVSSEVPPSLLTESCIHSVDVTHVFVTNNVCIHNASCPWKWLFDTCSCEKLSYQCVRICVLACCLVCLHPFLCTCERHASQNMCMCVHALRML